MVNLFNYEWLSFCLNNIVLGQTLWKFSPLMIKYFFLMFMIKYSHYVLMLHFISKAFLCFALLQFMLSLKIMKYSPIKLELFFSEALNSV